MQVEPRVSIVIPVFNEEDTIVQVLDGIHALGDRSFEIIVVDDGSTDHSANLVSGPDVKLVRHTINLGYGAALKTGVREARGEIVLFFDADGQHDPSDILRVLAPMDGHDMIVGVRGCHAADPWFRRSGRFFLRSFVSFLTGVRIPDINCGLRAVRKSLLLPLLSILSDSFSFSTTSTVAFIKCRYTIGYVPINISKPGESTLKFTMLVKVFFIALRIINILFLRDLSYSHLKRS